MDSFSRSSRKGLLLLCWHSPLMCVVLSVVAPVHIGLLHVWQLTKMYKTTVTRLQEAKDWAKIRPAFTCDLWHSRRQREYFTLTMH